jgi:predicted DNA-binding protein with PD1-like motif
MDKPLSILSCTGNISLQDGKPVVHAHFSLVDMEGRIFGGHALSESTIFAGEVHLTALSGPPLERIYDPTTGLMLWSVQPPWFFYIS